MKEELTSLEKKILEHVVRPAIGFPYKSKALGIETMAQDLNFRVLLQGVKDLYHSRTSTPWNDEKDWYKLLNELI